MERHRIWAPGIDDNSGGGINTNIYTNDGTLLENRTVTLNGKNLSFNGNGNIGIGTSAPTAKLDVAGNMKVQTPSGIWITGKTGTGGITSSTKQTVTAYSPFLRQETSSGHFVNIGGLGDYFGFVGYDKDRTENGYDHNLIMDLNTGNVGIGVNMNNASNATAKLDVNGDVRVRTLPTGAATDQVVTTDSNGNLRKLNISQIAGTNSTNIYTSNGTLSGARTVSMGANNLMFTGTGNIGIGTSSPTAKLDVAGDIRTNAVIYNSDARLKKDVQNISNATATVNNLRSVTYHWNEAGKKKGGNDELQYGFIAQEVEKVLPSLVTTDTEGYKSVNYVAVVPVLVKAFQEKDEEVKKLQSEMEQMKKEVEQIKQLLKK